MATYLSGYVDEHDLCFLGGFPGPLREILGIWCEEVDCLFGEERILVEWNGAEYPARDFCEIIHTAGAQAIATYREDFYKGSPAVTVNRFGDGEAYFVAARMDERFQEDFFGMLLRKLGICGALKAKPPAGCTAQLRTDDGNKYVFVMNFTPEPAPVDVGTGGKSLISGEEIHGILSLPPWGFNVISTKE